MNEVVLLTITRMEFTAAVKRRPHVIALVAFALFSAAAVWLAAFEFSMRHHREGFGEYSDDIRQQVRQSYLSALDRTLFARFMEVGMLAVLIAAPLYVAGPIAAEHERKTFEFLALTDLNDVEIAAARFLSRVGLLMTIPLSGLPVMFACDRHGGVSASVVGTAWLLLLAVTGFVVALGLLMSGGMRRVGSAIFSHYAAEAIVFLALPMLADTTVSDPAPAVAATGGIVSMLDPFAALAAQLGLGNHGPEGSGVDRWSCPMTYGMTAGSLLAINAVCYRALGLRSTAPLGVRARRARRKDRRVWSTPVAWREVRTVAVHRRMAWMRLVTLALLLLLSSIAAATWFDDWTSGSMSVNAVVGRLQLLVIASAVLLWLLVALLASSSFSHELETATADSLLSTPLTGRAIILGKMAGSLRGGAFILAYLVVLLVLGGMFGRLSVDRALCVFGAIVVVAGTAAALGTLCSVLSGRSTWAAAFAAWFVAAFLAAPVLLSLPSGRRSPWVHRIGTPELIFDLLAGVEVPTIAVFDHLALYSLLALLMAAAGIYSIEASYRVCQAHSRSPRHYGIGSGIHPLDWPGPPLAERRGEPEVRPAEDTNSSIQAARATQSRSCQGASTYPAARFSEAAEHGGAGAK